MALPDGTSAALKRVFPAKISKLIFTAKSVLKRGPALWLRWCSQHAVRGMKS